MGSKRRILISVLVCAIIAALAFAIGESMGQRSMLSAINVELDSTQAELAFNRLLDERKLQFLLARRCVAQAANVIDIAEDQDTKLLAEFFNGKLDLQAKKYISDRDPSLVNKLKTFKSKYGSGWSEMECKGV